jgi:hypothetical protein
MKPITKVTHETVQRVKGALTLCCARCTRPIDGQEVFQVSRYSYGGCCIMQVEEERK